MQRAELKETIVQQQLKISKKGKEVNRALSNHPKIATPSMEPVNTGKLLSPEDLGLNDMSARISFPSDIERFTAAEQGLSPTESHPAPAPEVAVTPETFSGSASRPLKTPHGVSGAPITLKPQPTPSRNPTKPQAEPPSPTPTPPRKSSGWGSWGTSLLNTVPAAYPDGSLSLTPPPVKPIIEDPPNSKPLDSLNGPAWAGGRQGSTRRNKNSAFGSGVGKNLKVNTSVNEDAQGAELGLGELVKDKVPEGVPPPIERAPE